MLDVEVLSMAKVASWAGAGTCAPFNAFLFHLFMLQEARSQHKKGILYE